MDVMTSSRAHDGEEAGHSPGHVSLISLLEGQRAAPCHRLTAAHCRDGGGGFERRTHRQIADKMTRVLI
ncbi:hypothetical protein VZT92_017802 [Zoarces viviparus]|uniref:Uncharacterized protein n=1 Tax=Zoarces viviparus TaxID=48416 RepID=A0AAW1ENV8_ZOAVI